MSAEWSIRFWPLVGCHTFLSHCREDKQSLVFPVFEGLKRRGLIPWLDQHHCPTGRAALEALQDALLRCRHVVHFVTSASLNQGRGWNVAERTLCHLIQSRLTYQGAEFQHLDLPLVFVPLDNPALQRSVWQPLLERAVCWKLTRRPQETRVAWAIRMIRDFVHQEELWAEDIRKRLRRDSLARQHFGIEPRLLRRIRAADPAIVPS